MYNIGEYIKLKNSTLCGTIIDLKCKNNLIQYKVNINNKNTFVNENMIEKSLTNNDTKSKITITINTNNNDNFVPEIMIRHLTKDEALLEIERFIDKALIHNTKIIKIIHGKSGGILRKATHDYLNNSPYVKEYRLGYPHEGSYGVTIIFLK